MEKGNIVKSNNEIVIKPIKGFVNIDIKEIWRYRELLITLTRRDIKVRYTQTVFGILWAVIPPILSMVVFSIIFGTFLGVPSGEIPYPIFVYSGTILWTYFSTALSKSTNSIVSNSGMIQKIYFPRLILPISSTISGLLDFFISFSILIMLMFYYQIYPGLIGIFILPILLLITVLSSLGFGLAFSAMNAKYRDIGHALPFVIQLGFFITPVVYSINTLQEWSFLLWINPMTAVIESIRAGLLGSGAINWSLLAFSFITSLLFFILGIYYFKQVEKDIADVV